MSAWDDATPEPEYRGAHAAPPLNRAARRAYVRTPKTYKLTWATDHELHGLEVRTRALPLGTFMELIDLAATFEGMDTTDLSAEDAKAVRQLLDGFAGALMSWNLEEPELDADGEPTGGSVPVPCTAQGLYTQDIGFAMGLIQEWMSAVASVPAPLPRPSAAGEPSLEASMPMDVSSPSRAS
jgi:hypothetical protein